MRDLWEEIRQARSEAYTDKFIATQKSAERWQAIAEKLAQYLECGCERVDCEECSAFCPMPKSREMCKEDWIKEAKDELGYE